jgi:hypothetical protein
MFVFYNEYILLTAIGWTLVAVIQYTFTHKQYTEQHNEIEYTEQWPGIPLLIYHSYLLLLYLINAK